MMKPEDLEGNVSFNRGCSPRRKLYFQRKIIRAWRDCTQQLRILFTMYDNISRFFSRQFDTDNLSLTLSQSPSAESGSS